MASHKIDKNLLNSAGTNDRLNFFIDIIGETQKMVAEKISISPSLFGLILQGKRQLQSKHAYKLHSAYKLNLDWLTTGTGEPFGDKVASSFEGTLITAETKDQNVSSTENNSKQDDRVLSERLHGLERQIEDLTALIESSSNSKGSDIQLEVVEELLLRKRHLKIESDQIPTTIFYKKALKSKDNKIVEKIFNSATCGKNDIFSVVIFPYLENEELNIGLYLTTAKYWVIFTDTELSFPGKPTMDFLLELDKLIKGSMLGFEEKLKDALLSGSAEDEDAVKEKTNHLSDYARYSTKILNLYRAFNIKEKTDITELNLKGVLDFPTQDYNFADMINVFEAISLDPKKEEA